LLFNLLGDPLMRLQHPHEITLHAHTSVTAGERLEITGSSQIAGTCTIELVCRRDRMKSKPSPRREFDASHQALSAFDEAYLQANDRCWSSRRLQLEGGPFRTDLLVPLEAHGHCHVRVFLQAKRGFGLGATGVFVRRPRLAEATPSP
jgi:hypothetical protein